jgi:hypothetical protein
MYFSIQETENQLFADFLVRAHEKGSFIMGKGIFEEFSITSETDLKNLFYQISKEAYGILRVLRLNEKYFAHCNLAGL